MKLYYNSLKIAGLSAILLLTNCSKDFLNKPPEDQIVTANFYKTEEQVVASTNILYGLPWFNFNTKAFWAITELSGGNGRSWSGDVVNFSDLTVTGDNQLLYSAWESLYSVVAQSNMLLVNLPKYVDPSISQTVVNNALGEAHFMRGMAYFFLVRLFGAVPIIENNFEHVYDPLLPRHRVEDVYQFIINDFTFAEANCYSKLRTSTYANNTHVSSGSASAMLAKIYLYLKDYPKAREKSELVINSGEFKLYGLEVPGTDFDGLFRTKNNNNEESIVALQWTVDLVKYGVQNAVQASFALNSTITGTGDGWAVLGPTIDLQRAFEPGDIRRKSTIMLPGDFYPEINQAAGGFTVPEDANAQGTRAAIKKYVVGTPADNGGIGAMQKTANNTYLMRMAEVYLVHAESILADQESTSDPAALASFNKIRRRAGLGDKPNITQDDILRERRVEFAIEGDYWFDLGRINRAKAINIMNNQERGTYSNDNPPEIYSAHINMTEDKFLFPIPTSEVAKNPKFMEAPVPYEF
ncbi:RagB/SusD family nutrient uptake outer membrane protein [Chitinophaga caeni]|uniref:RagB/SusD family nutrient uptake outer membrane protein n=1 Tax=Chitinophaga caeni TaxID=2029983 RepID=A0A291QYN4_9BACT|nr:RagB/SusD family nutrient uptake outer membrane protein [Chitinophaga caeni]ATL49139.1 RagB/SusD family nutrient uptake outer membrane protein [Chitinophaga caeni]